jgi:hypothetical protein
MSNLPFVLTLVISGTLLGWLGLNQEPPKREKAIPKVKTRLVQAPTAAERSLAQVPMYGYPDPRGILLELRHPGGSCPASRFRNRSALFILWDDGNVVSMSPTFDYRRGRVSIAQASLWSREFQSFAMGHHAITCLTIRDRAARGDLISLRGRTADSGETTLAGPDPSFGNSAHVKSCDDCRSLLPLARLLEEIDQERRHGPQSETITGIPVEVYLEWKSCGCRNHPEIVDVSKEWPLPGERPAERCKRGTASFRLEDQAEIRLLSDALTRSAAVLDRGEIYTCFLRPILELRSENLLARR